MIKFAKDLIAPCRMNCGVCRAYLREKNDYAVFINHFLISVVSGFTLG